MDLLQDATDEFEAIHSSKAKNQLMDFVIGKLGESNSEAPTQQLQAQSDKARPTPAWIRGARQGVKVVTRAAAGGCLISVQGSSGDPGRPTPAAGHRSSC